MAERSPAPINVLPAEVLSSIFSTIVDASLYARSIGDKSFGRPEYPTLLASVCAHWRNIALDTSKLWSFVDFTRKSDKLDGPLALEDSDSSADDSDDPELRRSNNLEHAKLYIERSQDSLLHIQIGKPLPGDKHRQQATRQWSSEMGNLLTTNISRIDSIALTFSHPDDFGAVMLILVTKAAELSLRNLGFRLEPAMLMGLYRPPALTENQGHMFKNLVGLYLDQISIDPRYLTCCHLVELHITILPANLAATSIVQIGEMLENSPSIRVFKFDTRLTVLGSSSPPRPIHMPALRHLYLGTLHGSAMAWLLASLVLSSHEVEVFLEREGFRQIDQSGLNDTVVSFLQRTQVTSLHIGGRWILLPQILAHAPRLRSLRLTLYDIDKGIFDGIEQVGPNLAELHTIEMNECHVGDETALDPGLKFLLTLPSVRSIRHYACGGISTKARRKFHQLLENDQSITAAVFEAPNLSFKLCPSLLHPSLLN